MSEEVTVFRQGKIREIYHQDTGALLRIVADVEPIYPEGVPGMKAAEYHA